MTRNTERIDASRKKEASSSKVFVVAKDPAMHFGDTKPAFPGHGAVLLEVDDLDFYEHLAELLAEEQPDLADSLVPMAAVELKPAALIRARKELARTRDIVSHLDCEELRPRSTVFRTIAITAHALSSHADDLREVLPQVIQRSQAHLKALRRHAAVVCECWKLLNAAGASSPHPGIVIPQPLTREFELLKMLLEQSMPALSECELHDLGTRALSSIIVSLTSVDPDEREVLDEYLHNSIQAAEQFIARLTVQFGGDAAALTPRDRASIDAIRRGIACHAPSAAEAEFDPWECTPSTVSQPTPAVSAVTATAPKETKPIDPTSHQSEAVSDPTIKWRRVCSRLAFDDEGGKLMLDGVVHDFEGNTTKQYLLMMVISRRLDHWNGPDVLEGPDSPWFGGDCTMDALGSCASKIRKSLRAKKMYDLATAIRTRNFRQSPQARLAWPPPARNVT